MGRKKRIRNQHQQSIIIKCITNKNILVCIQWSTQCVFVYAHLHIIMSIWKRERKYPMIEQKHISSELQQQQTTTKETCEIILKKQVKPAKTVHFIWQLCCAAKMTLTKKSEVYVFLLLLLMSSTFEILKDSKQRRRFDLHTEQKAYTAIHNPNSRTQ